MAYTLETVKALLSRSKRLSAENALHTVVEIDGAPDVPCLVIKYGHWVWKTEALAMQLVHDSTHVPVPKVYQYFSERIHPKLRCGYIVMEKVRGETLASVIDSLSSDAVDTISLQLARYLNEMGVLDGHGWGMPGKNGMYHRTRFNYNLGPTRITSTKAFINYFAKAAQMPLPDDSAQVEDLLQGIDLARKPIFSHGDLLPENIMYDTANGEITAIIDWECAGWYPYFWNTYIARNRLGPRSENWKRIYSSAMEECTSASITFSKYDFYADLNSSSEFSDKIQRIVARYLLLGHTQEFSK